MEARFIEECVKKLKGCGDSRERREILHRLEPIIAAWEQVEKEVLFPVLHRFLGFNDWIQEARARQSSLRSLLHHANGTQDHERILDITDELGDQLLLLIDGVRNVLFPRLIQTLPRPELEDLQIRIHRLAPAFL